MNEHIIPTQVLDRVHIKETFNTDSAPFRLGLGCDSFSDLINMPGSTMCITIDSNSLEEIQEEIERLAINSICGLSIHLETTKSAEEMINPILVLLEWQMNFQTEQHFRLGISRNHMLKKDFRANIIIISNPQK